MMPKFAEYSKVELVSDAFVSEGAQRGMIGYIIEVYPDEHYEVEFSRPQTGVSFAQIVVKGDDIVAADPPAAGTEPDDGDGRGGRST